VIASDTGQPLDHVEVRRRLEALGAARAFSEAEAALDEFAAAIGWPMMAWTPDIGRPLFDPVMDAFNRRHGWPDKVLALWWDRRVMLKMPIYIRCRTQHLPFATALDEIARGGGVEVRRFAAATAALGMRTVVTTPVHLPRGRIAMVSWLGSQDVETAEALLATLRAELFLAGHVFMDAYERAFARDEVAAEDQARVTVQEWECLRLLAQGHRDTEIAALKGLAPITVRFHLVNVVRKLGAANRTHAVALAAQLGMLGVVGR
jgi:DNA-binding CsgD family transcriptional regulator